MRIIPLVLTALALAGCPEMTKQVPDEALTDIPPDRIDELAAMGRRIDTLEDGIALQKQQVQRAQEHVDLEDRRFDTLTDRLRSEDRLKQTAVERGDREAAEAADMNREAIRERLDQARQDLEEATMDMRIETADLHSLEAEHKFREAELELARAQAVSGRREIDVEAYRQNAEEARLEWEQARRQRDTLGRDETPMAP